MKKHASSTASVICHDFAKTIVSSMIAGAGKWPSRPDDIAAVVLRYNNKHKSRYVYEESDEDDD